MFVCLYFYIYPGLGSGGSEWRCGFDQEVILFVFGELLVESASVVSLLKAWEECERISCWSAEIYGLII